MFDVLMFNNMASLIQTFSFVLVGTQTCIRKMEAANHSKLSGLISVLFLLFSGTVYNLTLKLTNVTYTDDLTNPHSPQFVKLRMDFEVGVSICFHTI